MADQKKEQQKKIKNILVELQKDDTAKQIAAVKSLKIHGDESVIEPLVQVMSKTRSEELSLEIETLLNTIKFTTAPPKVVRCLQNPEFAHVRQKLLSSMWNSGLDYRPYLAEIAEATVSGEFMDAMECITIIENQEGYFEEKPLMDALLVFKTYLVDHKDADDPKTEIIKEIVIQLQQMNDNL